MRSRIWNPAGFIPVGVAMLLSAQAPAFAGKTEIHSVRLDLADGQIACRVLSQQAEIPPQVLTILPIAVNAAWDHIGPPTGKVQLTLRLQPPPSFFGRLLARFRPEPAASQHGDEILLHAGDDPLKLAFRLAHELSHWLVQKKYPARPPLWLDEGLASLVGAESAATSARVHKQDLARPPPPHLDQNLCTLDELAALTAYPSAAERSAAFYWQAEALVGAIRRKLGPVEFRDYLGQLCIPNAPDWQAPLRDRWYFSEADFRSLGRAIRPGPKPANQP